MENCIVRYNPSCGWVSGWMVRVFFLPYFLQGCLQLQSMENSTARVGSMSHPMCTAVVSRLSSLFTEFELKWNLWIYQQKTRSIVLFVQTCYGRLHGPKGYGFGGGAGTLNTDSGNQIESEEKEKIQWGWMKISYFAIILQNYGWPSSSETGTQSRHQRAPPARKGKVVPGAAATFIMQIRSRIEMIMRFPWLWVWKGSDLLSQNLPIIHWQEVSNPPRIMVIARCSLARVKSGTKSVSAAIAATGILTPGPYFFTSIISKALYIYHMSNDLPFHSRLPHFIFVWIYL